MSKQDEHILAGQIAALTAQVNAGFVRNSEQNKAILERHHALELKVEQSLNALNGRGALHDRVAKLESGHSEHARLVWKAYGFLAGLVFLSSFFGAKAAGGLGSILSKLFAAN